MEDVVGDDTARMRSRSARSNGKDRQDSTVASFWLPLLRSAAKEVALSKDDQADLLQTVESSLNEQFAADFDDDLLDLLQYDDHALNDRIASESRGLKRDVRRTQKKQDLLIEEQARLESFRPSRKAHEQDEAREVAERLHPLARQYLSTKPSVRRSMPSTALQELGRAKRDLENLEEGLVSYEPEEDAFLVDLLDRLKASNKSKKAKR